MSGPGFDAAERSATPAPSPRAGAEPRPGWEGPTYYGRPQLKAAPFNKWVVGTYIFLAGLSGSASLLGAVAEAVDGKAGASVARRSRRLALLAPTIGSALLIQDLHTPKRFYNMLRVAKPRSPMSIGTWILMGFSAAAVPAAIADGLASLWPRAGWLRGVARLSQAPAAAAGAGLSVYTAALLSSTSTPAWAAAPRALAVRFAASSAASGAAALLLGERARAPRRALQALTAAALTTEVAAASVQARALRETGVEQAHAGVWGKIETFAALGAGAIAPLALLGAAVALGRRNGRTVSTLADTAAVCVLAGSALLRVATLGVGDDSAVRPEISLRFAQPRNLPTGG